MALGEELQGVALELQEEVGAGIGDDIALVWGMPAAAAPVPGGSGVGKYGTRLSTGDAATSRPDQRVALKGAYYCRRGHNADGGASDFGGQLVNPIPWVFTFNENQEPDISAGDVMTLVCKREISQTVQQIGWRANFVYAEGTEEMPQNLLALVSPSKRVYFEAITGGQSGPVEPTWPTQKGQTVNDGSVVWKCLGRLLDFQVKDPGGKDTVPVERVVTAIEVTQ
ncbi:MAG: hypothetical protein KY445_02730 [Armatimonadetes bacterium]|nr:hypothetical protein [Armatimonadota bacterium]